ncbi:phospho-sugar mutase [Arthrobacter sp. B2a2-09]|uniref:phospho-sugar mutase n=1 Tax=Arthrobacter sp. B2a2-09 TaxID=2952822 RepID=UPI0022CD7103|nr:phospho-sugar mutase [Arthrobacter sp. B2a2-09]MCZ9884923.1 phospho-sugar mutase [Arthrobacter sp. B2a2-09]
MSGPQAESSSERIQDAARLWHSQDPDPETREELAGLIAAAAQGDPEASEALEDRFGTRLGFGTAGLRGALGAGPNRMNRVLVAQTAAGLADYLRTTLDSPSIVIGYDARKNSSVFARDTAEIMAARGVDTTVLPRELPTPVLAFAVRHLDASAGVMVTASHNPAPDNGYKVYLGGHHGGAQIVAPQDRDIAAAIDNATATPVTDYQRSTDYRIAPESVVDEYIRLTAKRGIPGTSRPKVVYTPLHGVGWETARQVFADAGFDEPLAVPEQQHPDPRFPTTAFPNPEEPGALDLAFAAAKEYGADLVIANDPDADRLAAAIPSHHGWRQLTGNELGIILGWQAATRSEDHPRAQSKREGMLVASIVSSPGLAEIARRFGLNYAETLTGFKWIARVPGITYGFEEALGYLVDPDKIRDKDGISAAVDLLSLVSGLRDRGLTVEQHLNHIATLIGGHASEQVSIRTNSSSQIAALMAGLRSAPPNHVGTDRVQSIDDFIDGHDQFPPSDIIRIFLEGGTRVVVRPSGTEPKLKAYIDTRSSDGTGEERLTKARADASRIAASVHDLLAP